MTRSALQARSYRVLSEQLQRLRTPAERDHFMQGAHDALTWLVEGRSAPLTGRLNWPIHGHDVADERAVATALAHQESSPLPGVRGRCAAHVDVGTVGRRSSACRCTQGRVLSDEPAQADHQPHPRGR
jgi:hypothetical protein